MSNQDQLATTIANFRDDWYAVDRKPPAKIDRDEAGHLISEGWAKLRTITNDAELHSLEVESIIRDVDGLPKEKQVDSGGYIFWAAPGHKEKFSSRDVCYPATVLYEPQP